MKKYTSTHEWIEQGDASVKVGISAYAASQLGDIVFIELPDEGESVTAGKQFANVESVKAVSEIYSPVSGMVIAVNNTLFDQPELVNQDAEEAWFIEVDSTEIKDDLMEKLEYDKQCI